MEKTYFCLGCTESYGRNRMYEYDFITTDKEQEAFERAEELSYDVIDEYSYVLSDIYEDEDTMLSEELCAEYYIVNIDKNIDELFKMVNEYGIEDFIHKFCKGF